MAVPSLVCTEVKSLTDGGVSEVKILILIAVGGKELLATLKSGL